MKKIDWVEMCPIFTTLLLEWANVSQIWRMLTDHSALGQNPWSWVSVALALWVWVYYYRVKLGPDCSARRVTLLGIMINAWVIMIASSYRRNGITAALGWFSFCYGLYDFAETFFRRKK